MTTNNARASIIPTSLYKTCATRKIGAATAKRLSRQFPNVPFALMTYFAQDRCYVEVYRSDQHVTGKIFHAPTDAGLYAVYINGRVAKTVDNEVENPPEVEVHRLVVCIDYVVPKGHAHADDPALVGADLIIKALKEGQKDDGDTDHCIEHPNFWLDPQEDDAVLPEEWGAGVVLYTDEA